MKTGIDALDRKIDDTLAMASRRFGAAAVERIAKSRLTQFEDWEPADSLQRPSWLFTPGIETRPFWERGQCGRLERVIDALEAAGPRISEEVRSLDPASGITYHHLSVSPDQVTGWKNWFFYQDHLPNDALLARVPTVRSVVESFGREYLDRFEIHLSLLEPSAHIPPHCGGVNAKLTLHLPLAIPEGDTAIRVASSVRGWTEGRVLVFDDSYEHEAWNRTSQRRAVLLLTAYHPDLSLDEIGVIEMLEPLNVEVYRAYLREQRPAA